MQAIPTLSQTNENFNWKCGHNCIPEPNQTCNLPYLMSFKIPFVNIVVLPKYLDELRFIY